MAPAKPISGGSILSGTTPKEIIVFDYSAVNISSAIANNGANATLLTLTCPSTTTLNGTNSNTGQTTLLGGGTTSITGTMGNSAISVNAATLSRDGTGAVSQNTVTLYNYNSMLTESVPNALSGTAALTVNLGTATLSKANNYTGATTMNGGTLNLASACALGAPGTTLVNLTGGTIDNTFGALFTSAETGLLDSANGGTVNFGSAGETSANNITFTGTVSVAGDIGRTLNILGTGMTVSLAGTVTNSAQNSAQTLTVNGAGNTLVLGPVVLNSVASAATAFTETINGTGNVTLAGAVTNGTSTGAQSLTFSSSGTLGLGNATFLSSASEVFTFRGGTVANVLGTASFPPLRVLSMPISRSAIRWIRARIT